MTASEDIDNLVIVPPEKPLKMRAQPIMPPRVKRMWQKLWLKPREERREADRGRNGAGAREHAGSGAGDGRNRPALRPWYGAEYAMLVHRRRRLLSTLVIVTVALGLLKWAAAMPSDITVWTRAAVIVLFVLTFGWIALYFWSSILGFSQLLKRARMPGITYPADVEAALDAEAGIAAGDLRARQNPAAPTVREMASFIKAKTAVLMPIYNEEPAQVMARLLAIGEDLQQAGAGGRFDIFVLSDTTNPKIWVKEEKIWLEAKRILESGSFGAESGELRESVAGAVEHGVRASGAESRSDTEAAGRSGGTAGGAGLHIYYRRRAQNTARKSGNIEDFCNRWGAEYDFMLVLDADSLMTAETLSLIHISEPTRH